MLSVTELRLSKNVDTQSALTKLLGISGRDPMPVEGKNKAEETLELDVRIWIESNEIVGMPDSTGAFAARLIIFRVKERTGEEDTTLKAQVKQHMPAIFNWFRAGYLRLVQRGKFIQPASSLPVLVRIRYDGNPLLEFFETQIAYEPGVKVLRGSIFDYCERWHTWNRKKYYGPSWVGREAQKHGIGSYQDRRTRLRYYKDIRLKTPEEGGFPWFDMEALDNLDGIGDGHDDGLGGGDGGDSM